MLSALQARILVKEFKEKSSITNSVFKVIEDQARLGSTSVNINVEAPYKKYVIELLNNLGYIARNSFSDVISISWEAQ